MGQLNKKEMEYELALKCFSQEIVGSDMFDLANKFTKKHKDELIYCYHNNKSILDFDLWCHYEELLDEKITFDEYYSLDLGRDYNILEIEKNDKKEIDELKKELKKIRDIR